MEKTYRIDEEEIKEAMASWMKKTYDVDVSLKMSLDQVKSHPMAGQDYTRNPFYITMHKEVKK